MARITSITGWRSRLTGAGIAGSAVLKRKSDATTLDTATTDANGLGSHDVDYPGPHTVTLTSGGETRTIDSDVAGFAGSFSLLDLEVAFRAFASGVVPGYLDALALAPGSGRAVNVGTGAALALGLPFVNDAALDVAIDANASGNPRIDLIVVRLERTYSAGVREVGRRYLTKVTGTAAATPAAPSPTQTADVWDVVLGQVTVASGAGSFVAGNIATTGRTWMAPNRVEPASLAAGATTNDFAVTSTSVGAFVVENGAGLDVLVVDTSGQAVGIPNATLAVDTSTGNAALFRARLAGVDVFLIDTINKSAFVRMDGIGALIVEKADGTHRLVVDTQTPGAYLQNGTDLAGYTDTGATQTWRLYSATGVLQLGGTGGPSIRQGVGSPEGAVAAPVGSMFLRSDGGPGETLYVKEVGTGVTGWDPKA